MYVDIYLHELLLCGMHSYHNTQIGNFYINTKKNLQIIYCHRITKINHECSKS